MKILVIPSWYPPIGGRFFKLQAEALAKLGHDVDVLILEEKGLTQKVNKKIDASKSEFVNEIRFQYLRIPKLNNLNIKLFVKKYQRILLDYLKKKKPDIIHIHSAIWGGVVVADIAKQKNIPYVITEHRSLFFEEKMPFLNEQIQDIKYALNSAEKLISVSTILKNAVNKYTENTIEVLPNMVNTKFFKFQERTNNAEKFTFLSIGNLIPVKGFDVLLNVFAELHNSNKNIHLKIVGVGKDRDKLIQQTQDLNIKTSVEFCGYKTREELRDMFKEATALVSSSRKETFGLSIAEALCCGLPIVVTKSGGPQDIVNESNGYLAEKENASSLQAKMQLMIDNINNFDREKISRAALETYSEKSVGIALEKTLKNVATKSN